MAVLKNSDCAERSDCCCAEGDCATEPSGRTIPLTMLPSAKPLPHWVTGSVDTPAGKVHQIATRWTTPDYIGMIRSRVSAYRMKYSVPPGLYAVGWPDKGSDVFVTANYKLSFDILRRSLGGLDAWVLVLDTKSINVWCAAGKGTFGTEELIRRIKGARLSDLVAHKRIIIPQLGAVGVNAARVQKNTGFRVYFGPVLARHIPAYIEAGYKKTREMSLIPFSMLDRLILTPMEINPALKKFIWYAAAVLLFFGIAPSGILFRQAWEGGLPFLMLGLMSIFAGSFITPVFLPFIPFRSFALKGLLTGIATALLWLRFSDSHIEKEPLLFWASLLMLPASSSYLALQFTGATTFTGISGVRKEVRLSLPFYIGAIAASIVLLLIYKIRQWGAL